MSRMDIPPVLKSSNAGRRWLGRLAPELAKFEFAPIEVWRYEPHLVYPLRCGERAGVFVLLNTGSHALPRAAQITLVNGHCTLRGKSFGHAWVDLGDGLVFDGSLQAFFTVEGFARMYGAVVETRTSPQEVRRQWKTWAPQNGAFVGL